MEEAKALLEISQNEGIRYKPSTGKKVRKDLEDYHVTKAFISKARRMKPADRAKYLDELRGEKVIAGKKQSIPTKKLNTLPKDASEMVRKRTVSNTAAKDMSDNKVKPTTVEKKLEDFPLTAEELEQQKERKSIFFRNYVQHRYDVLSQQYRDNPTEEGLAKIKSIKSQSEKDPTAFTEKYSKHFEQKYEKMQRVINERIAIAKQNGNHNMQRKYSGFQKIADSAEMGEDQMNLFDKFMKPMSSGKSKSGQIVNGKRMTNDQYDRWKKGSMNESEYNDIGQMAKGGVVRPKYAETGIAGTAAIMESLYGGVTPGSRTASIRSGLNKKTLGKVGSKLGAAAIVAEAALGTYKGYSNKEEYNEELKRRETAGGAIKEVAKDVGDIMFSPIGGLLSLGFLATEGVMQASDFAFGTKSMEKSQKMGLYQGAKKFSFDRARGVSRGTKVVGQTARLISGMADEKKNNLLSKKRTALMEQHYNSYMEVKENPKYKDYNPSTPRGQDKNNDRLEMS